MESSLLEEDNDEALEQMMLTELEALRAIYDEDFVVHPNSASSLSSTTSMVEASLLLTIDSRCVRLRIQLPSGYPMNSPLQVSVSVEGWLRRQEEEVTRSLQEKARSLIGQEAVMELVYELQDLVDTVKTRSSNEQPEAEVPLQTTTSKEEPTLLCRRCWIWAHHITDTARRKAIVLEARERKLGGYLKSGYPGIVVVEGYACDDFVTWIKGNKSRPGGFGRNWGHHVKGEVISTTRQLPLDFVELAEMQDLGALCKEHTLEEEFLFFVMQHKGKKTSETDD